MKGVNLPSRAIFTGYYYVIFWECPTPDHYLIPDRINLLPVMPPPSTNLLQAIRATEYIQSSLPLSLARQARPSCRCSSPLSPFHSNLRSQKSRPIRAFSSTPISSLAGAPESTERGPASQEDTRTDFGILDVLANTPPPSTAIDACLSNGFHLENGVKITGGSGCLLVGGEAFSWRPWLAGSRPGGSAKGRMINRKGQWDVEKEAWGLLELVWPKPGE